MDIPFPKFGMVLRIILRQKIDKEKGTSFYSFGEREREREKERKRKREWKKDNSLQHSRDDI